MIAMNPNERFEVVLDNDMNLPEDEQPRFIYHYLTGLEKKILSDLIDKLQESKTGSAAIDRVFEAAEMGLVDLKNVKNRAGEIIEFAKGKLLELLCPGEAMELALKIFYKGITKEDKKKLESQPP